MTKPDQEFLKRVKDIAGANITEFARRLGMRQSQVHAYVTGQTTPSYQFFFELWKRGVDLNWLFGGSVRGESMAREEQEVYETNADSFYQMAQRIAVKLSGLPSKDIKEIMEMIDVLAAQKRRKSKTRREDPGRDA